MHSDLDGIYSNLPRAVLTFKGIALIRSIIAIIILMIIAIYAPPALAYGELINFDQNIISNLSGCSNNTWYLDGSEGHDSSPALHSGIFRNSGMSCVGIHVEGPANLKFFWKSSRYSRNGELSFNVDNESVVTCTSSEWIPISYTVAPGIHWLSWVYKKQYSYPEYEGAGWIDDIQIEPYKIRPEINDIDSIYNGSIDVLKQDINRFDRRLSAIEHNATDQIKKAADLNKSIGITIYGVIDHLGRIENEIAILKKNMTDQNNSINASISEFNKRVEYIDNTCSLIANASQNGSIPSDLSWINDQIVFVSDEDSNLTDVLIKNKHKVIVLGDGVYHTDGLLITSDDVYLRSLRKWGAKIDMCNNSRGITIDTANNVTLDSLEITNCTDGIHIENASNCNIANNLIKDFNRIAIIVVNSSQSTFILNSIIPKDITQNIGIKLKRCSNNTFALNEIEIGSSDDDSYLYESILSRDNTIILSDNGRIWDDGSVNSDDDDVYCELWDCSVDCKFYETDVIADLSKSENIWILPSIP